MTTIEDDVRAALRQRAETHDVVVPDLGALVREPYAADPTGPSHRRLVVGVAAALLVVGLAAVAVAVAREEPVDPGPLDEPGPVAGTHGAVLVGLGPPVDGSEAPIGSPVPPPDSTLVVLRARGADTTAVVAFAPDTGTSSFDVYPFEGGTATTVGGNPATLHPPTHVQPDLSVLEVDRAGDQRLFVGGIGLDDGDLTVLAEAALGADDPESRWWPADRYQATYVGPDANPMAGQRGDERVLAYGGEDGDGGAVVVLEEGVTVDPTDYAWFVPGGRRAEIAGRTVLTWSRDGRELATWVEGGGVVTVGTPEGRLEEAVAAVRVVDEATWEAELASATDRGSRFASATTEAAPGTTTG